LFESELSNVEPLRNLIKAISVVVEEGSFRIDEGQMRLLAMDPSHVAMVDFELPREFFDRYSAEGEARLSMNMRELLKFLDRVGEGGTAQDKIGRGAVEGHIGVQAWRPYKDLHPAPHRAPWRRRCHPRRSSSNPQPRLLTQSLRRAIRDASLVSEHVRIEMTSKELRIQASGEAGSVSSVWEMGADDLLELKAQEDSRATFTISYLQDMINAAAMSSEVTSIELSTDMPIKMNFELPQGKLIYYLAPCIGV
jgi:proliferating cell nuclear antigen